MGHFDTDTAIDDRGGLVMSARWNIADSANGGYAAAPVLRHLASLGEHPDPLTVTTHYLRPTQGDVAAQVRGETIRNGRTTSAASGRLIQHGKDTLITTAVFGDLSTPVGSNLEISPPPPAIPSPEECFDRANLEQGVALPILQRVDVAIHPERSTAGGADEAVVEGWIRFRDGTAPTTLALPLFADAFPPSLFAKLSRVGWVPTIELTVQVRRRPAPGWIQARFECDDLSGGRMIETGSLWDSTGALVARSRQLGLLLPS